MKNNIHGAENGEGRDGVQGPRNLDHHPDALLKQLRRYSESSDQQHVSEMFQRLRRRRRRRLNLDLEEISQIRQPSIDASQSRDSSQGDRPG